MTDEIELKLDLTPEAADALDAAPFWPGEAAVADQRSIYFDTPGRALSKAGLSLRIRRSGHRRVQTVKAERASTGGLFVRSEWERSVDDDTPVIDDTTPLCALLGDKASAVAPAFEVRVERRTWVVEEEDASIELVLDRGEVVMEERASPICEIELELKSGRPAALFAFARRLDAVAPVRLGVQSKAKRGYRLTGPASFIVKAEPVELTVDLTAAEAFRVIVQSCLRHYRLNEALLLTSRKAGALHQARVALRGLRSALYIFKPVTGGNRQFGVREELRWLAAELGKARNLDVLLERSSAGDLHDLVAAAREAAYDRVHEVLASARVRALMLDLAEWIATGDWLEVPDTETAHSQPARAFARAALDRLRRRVRKGGRDLIHADDETRHELRKDAKKLRYGAEFFAGLFDAPGERRRHKKFVGALEALQDELGALNDLATAPEVLEELSIANDPEALQLLARGKRKALLASAADAHEDLIDANRFWR